MRERLFYGLASILVVGAIGGGLWLVGSPDDARLQKLDDRRVQDLQQIVYAVERYAEEHEELPTLLEDVQQQYNFVLSLTDPEDQEPYVYRTSDSLAFSVCATFARATTHRPSRWSHPAGYHCFEHIID